MSTRMNVLMGNIDASTTKYLIPSSRLVIFVSSTFTDTHIERNILIDKILSNLQYIAKRNNVTITFVDMRYGVRDENTWDHLTWISCKIELERCMKESCGMCFLSLQSSKYGYQPIPKYLSQIDLDDKLYECKSIEVKSIANYWYLLDTNHIPPRYFLRPLTYLTNEEKNLFWNAALPALRELLYGIVFDEDYKNLQVGEAITHWECKVALSSPSSASRCLWSFRKFGEVDDLETEITEVDDQGQSYYDCRDNYIKRQSLNELLELMSKSIKKKYVFPINFSTYSNQHTKEWQEFISNWQETIENKLLEELDTVIVNRKNWEATGDGIGLSGEILEDVFTHYIWAIKKLENFQGRANILLEAMSYIKASNREYDQQFSGISFGLVAASGLGKTSILAKLTSMISKADHDDDIKRPVIVRFCGINKESINGYNLIKSITTQALFLHHDKNYDAEVSFPKLYSEAVDVFQKVLNEYPLVLIIDSMDQIDDSNCCRSQLSFLRGVNPHPLTRIVISTLPDDKSGICYWSERRLLDGSVPIINLQPLTVENKTIH